MPDSDRRGSTRHLACFPAHILNAEDDSPRSALISDLSTSGALLMTRVRLDVGSPIKLTLYIAADTDDAPTATARVVRVEKRSIERSDVWPYNIAVEFD